MRALRSDDSGDGSTFKELAYASMKPILQILEINGISNANYLRALAGCRAETLRLVRFTMTPQAFDELLQLMPALPALHTLELIDLDVQDMPLQPGTMAHLPLLQNLVLLTSKQPDGMGACPLLQVILPKSLLRTMSIESQHLSLGEHEAIADAVVAQGQLGCLALSQLPKDAWFCYWRVAQQAPLKAVVLAGCTPVACNQMARALCSNPAASLSIFGLNFCVPHEDGENEAIELAALVNAMPALRSLNIRDCQFGAGSALADLLMALHGHPGLKRLSLTGTPLTDSGSKALMSFISATTGLTKLSIDLPAVDEQLAPLADAVRHNLTLRTLYLEMRNGVAFPHWQLSPLPHAAELYRHLERNNRLHLDLTNVPQIAALAGGLAAVMNKVLNEGDTGGEDSDSYPVPLEIVMHAAQLGAQELTNQTGEPSLANLALVHLGGGLFDDYTGERSLNNLALVNRRSLRVATSARSKLPELLMSMYRELAHTEPSHGI